MHPFARHALSVSAALILAACGGGGGSDDPDVTPTTAPTITTAPVSSTVNAGGTATLSVVAAGGGTLSYQWKVNGVDIPGATAATYTTPTLTSTDTGKSYTVVVTNSAGSATSTAAVLSVNAVQGAIALSQESATQLVATVNGGVADLRRADATGSLPFGARTVALPLAATVSQTMNCSDLGGGNGSGTLDYTITTNDSTGQPTSVSFTYNNCVFGTAGYSYRLDGTGSATYSNYVSATNYTFRLTYDVRYSFTAGSYTDSGTVNSVETCRINGELESCTTTIGSNEISNVNISTSGTVTTVADARIANNQIDCDYTGWVYDASSGQASAGTVTVTSPNGASAVITATGNGYTVRITVGGTTNTYTVALGG